MSATRPSFVPHPTANKAIAQAQPPVLASGGFGVRALSLLLFAVLLGALLLGSGVAAAAPARQDSGLNLVADAAIVVEYPSGKILYQKNAYDHRPMASTTKIMTALLALQRLSLTETLTIQPEALVGEAAMGLVADEKISVEDVLYGMLLPSGNDAAMSLAIAVGNKLTEPTDATPVQRFVALMNSQAQAMGLSDTHFANPHGLDAPGHYTSATDLASIAWYAMHDPEFNAITRTVYKDEENHSLKNLNKMLTTYDGADGVKTGQTDNAGLCLVSSATRNGRRLVAVVLNSYRWYDDSTKLLDYGFSTDPAAPTDTLNIAKRAQLLWLLASGLPTPLPTARPTAPPATPAAAADSVQIAAVVTPESQPVLAPATAPAPDAAISSALVQSQATPDNGAWLLPLAALILGVGVLLVYWRKRSGASKPTADSWAEKKERLTAPGDTPAPAAAPAAPIKTQPTRVPLEAKRISLMDDDSTEQHAKRAIALAYRGQEGSSLAEFMIAVGRDPEFEYGTLEGFYDMPPAGYLSLARAYTEHQRPHYARALLQLGTETYPDDKIIRKMLAGLSDDAQANLTGAQAKGV